MLVERRRPIVRVGFVVADGTSRRLLDSYVTTVSVDSGPSWSPDASALAYSATAGGRVVRAPSRGRGGPPSPSVRQGSMEIRVIRVEGGKPRAVSRGGSDWAPRWSPRGDSILFTRRLGDSAFGLYSAPAAGGASQKLVGGLLAVEAAWSPDARFVAYSGVRIAGDRRYHLFAVSEDGGRLRRLANDVASTRPAWSPDGRLLAYATWDGSVRTVGLEGSRSRLLTRLPGAEVRDLAWSPDGRRLAFVARVVPEG